MSSTASNPQSAPTPPSVRSRGPAWLWNQVADRSEPAVEWLIRICGWSSIFFVFAIFAFVFRTAWPVLFGGINLVEFFTSPNWQPSSEVHPRFGILALMAGTFAVTVLSMLMAVPLGLGAAVYISEFATGKFKETLKILIELLAAIPSIVWGFIGYMVLGPLIIKLTGAPVGVNLLNGSIILALMSVPIIVSVGEDSLKAVPDSYREAALSLGATRWEIVYRVLFPAAKNGLLAAVLLGVGRAIGETMAVLMATGHAVQIPHSLLDPIRTLTATIAAELGEAEDGGTHSGVLFLIGVVLFAIAFTVNLAADLVVKGIRSEKRR
jgi:phosphate transport system permease protein